MASIFKQQYTSRDPTTGKKVKKKTKRKQFTGTSTTRLRMVRANGLKVTRINKLQRNWLHSWSWKQGKPKGAWLINTKTIEAEPC
ncbi:MAG: hypothetical protein ACYSYW_14500 [Planctomycetota bacterium]|jgi:hypothetical protein